MRDTTQSLEYLGAHLEETLATDPRVAEQGVHVDIVAGGLVVSGTVSTPDRHAAIRVRLNLQIAFDGRPLYPTRGRAVPGARPRARRNIAG